MVEIRKCTRCLHEWASRKGVDPKFCPKCHSPYWDKPRVRDKVRPPKSAEELLKMKLAKEKEREHQ